MALSAIVSLNAQTNMQATLVLQDLTYTAIATGDVGNSITIAYTDPGAPSSPIAVLVVGSAISVSLATDVSSVITSTATQVKAAIDGDSGAHVLVTVAISGTGSNVQAPVSATALANGGNATPYNARIMALVTISNSGGSDVTVRTLQPLVGNNTGIGLGIWGPAIQPLTVPAAGSVVATFPLVPFAPQVVGPFTDPLRYSVGCSLITSDGSSFAATPAVLTVAPTVAN